MRKALTASVLASALMITSIPVARAAIPVIDLENIAQAVATVTNTLTQIQNQLLELRPMDSGTLQERYQAISDQVNGILSNRQNAQGIMNPNSAATTWQTSFGVDAVFDNSSTVTPSAQLANSRNAAYVLDKTYQDAYRTAKSNADLSQEWANIQALMTANQNVDGNKSALQVQNGLLAQQNVIMMKQVQSQASLQSVLAATAAAQNREDAQTTAQNAAMIEKLAKYSPPNPTSCRRGIY